MLPVSWLRILRKKQGLTMSEIAERLGISVQMVYQYEKGIRTPKQGERWNAVLDSLNLYQNDWIPCDVALPSDVNEDWVLVQIKERDSGSLWIPKVGEFQQHTNSWWIETDDGIWNVANYHGFDVIAWHVIPSFDLSIEERNHD